MILGLRTAIYHVPDLERAKAWYISALGHAPYFDEPFYVGFNVGGFELGLDPDMSGVTPGVGGVEAYWGVENAETELARLESLGAKTLSPLHEVGDGIRMAAVADPFGNAFNIIENPHFDRTAVR
jgi:predicted enzyme related to lactoylglutathione lyase